MEARVRVGGRGGGGGHGGGGEDEATLIAKNASHKQSSTGILVRPQQRAHMHNDPERRALAQPRHDVAVRAGGAGKSRLAHHAGAHDKSHVRLEEVR